MTDVKQIDPAKDLVVVKLLGIDEVYEDLISQGNSDESEIAVRYGEVISMGPDVDKHGHCKGLKVGEIVIFTEFAGHFITELEDHLYKVIRGYDIIGKAMKLDEIKNSENLVPTGDRVLVETINPNNDEDGIIMEADNPTQATLVYGKVLKVGESANKLNLKPDLIVAFAAYVGTVVRHYESNENKELKIIVENDILFTI